MNNLFKYLKHKYVLNFHFGIGIYFYNVVEFKCLRYTNIMEGTKAVITLVPKLWSVAGLTTATHSFAVSQLLISKNFNVFKNGSFSGSIVMNKMSLYL